MASDCKRPKVTLPHEIIIFDILSRLRVRDVCRFRCVSKSWDALISDPLFHRNHQRIRERNPLLLVTTIDDARSSHPKMTHSLLDKESKTLDPVTQLRLQEEPRFRSLTTAIASMGLVCTYDRLNVYVCNPVMKKWIHLAGSYLPGDGEICVIHASIGYITSTSSYKVFRVSQTSSPNGYFIKFEVLTLGSNHWRAVDGPPGDALLNTVFQNKGASIDGSVYLLWYANSLYIGIITVFDLKEEAWSVFPIPSVHHDNVVETRIYLTEMGGQLCLTYWFRTRVGRWLELWLLKGFHENRPIWEKERCIDMSMVNWRCPNILVIEQTGKILLQTMSDDGIRYKLICYDPNDRTIEEIYSWQSPITASFYIESFRSFVVKGFKNVPLQNEEWSLGQKKSNKKPTCQTSCEYPDIHSAPVPTNN